MPSMAAPAENPVSDVTSFVEEPEARHALVRQRLDELARAAGSIFVGVAAGRVTAWILGRVAQNAARPAAGPAAPRACPGLGRSVQPGDTHHRADGRAWLICHGTATAAAGLLPKTLLLLNTIAVLLVCLQSGRRGRRGGAAAGPRHRPALQKPNRAAGVPLAAGVPGGHRHAVRRRSRYSISTSATWLAGLGIAGLAVSLAAQDSLKNLFGSLSILMDHRSGWATGSVSCGYDGDDRRHRFPFDEDSHGRRTPGDDPQCESGNSTIENVSRRPAVRRVDHAPRSPAARRAKKCAKRFRPSAASSTRTTFAVLSVPIDRRRRASAAGVL